MFERQPWMQRAGEYPVGDREYFELLARCVFSAGLGARVVETRWEGLRQAFADFEPDAVARMGESDVARLLADPSVIRNRRKMEAVIEDARRFLTLTREHEGFAAFLCSVGVEDDVEAAAQAVAGRFVHLGPSSAAMFLFSAGWRQQQAAA